MNVPSQPHPRSSRRQLGAQRIAAIVLCMLLAACAARAPAVPIFLHFAPLAAGDARETLRTAQVRLRITQNIGGDEVNEHKVEYTTRERKLTELLAVAGGRPSHMRVTYALAEGPREGEATSVHALPVSGKSYEVVAEGDSLQVHGISGDATRAAEIQYVIEDWRQSGLDGSYAAFFEGKEFARGALYELSERESPAPPIAIGDNLKVPVYKLIARGMRTAFGEECLVFDAALRLVSESPGGQRARLDLNGEILISRARGWVMSLSLAGPFESRDALPPGEFAPRTAVTGEVRFDMESVLRAAEMPSPATAPARTK